MHTEQRKQRIRDTARRKYAKLTLEQVKKMRELYAQEHLSQSEIGRRFGVTPTQARNIVLGIQWK